MGKRGPSSETSKNAYFIGKAGEYATAAQLLIKQCPICWPAVDEGFDLLTNNGCRIQVRTTHILSPKHQSAGSYWFSFAKIRHINTLSTGVTKRIKKKKMSAVCDIVVCYGIEQNRFWIIPSVLCDKAQALVLGVDNKRRFYGSIQPMRDMKVLGYSVSEIARKYNMNRAGVHRLLKSDKTEQKETLFNKARAYENRWDLILDFGSKQDKVISEEVNGEQLEQTANLAGYGQQLP